MKDLTQQEIFDWFKDREKISYKAYKDGPGFSIGLGHFIKPNESYLLNKTLTQQEVLNLFSEDIKWTLEAIRKNVKVPINKNQQLALMSFVYNVGEPNFKKTRLLRALNSGNYAAAAILFPTSIVTEQGKFSQGLVNRRRLEQNLFLKPV